MTVSFGRAAMLLDVWAEHRTANPDSSDHYLDRLLVVREAGYLGEYTAYFHRRSEWQVPAELDVSAFGEWRLQHLRGHRPQTRVIGYWDYKEKIAQRFSEID